MNANVTTGIRELTAQELDQVNGGLVFEVAVVAFMAWSVVSGLAGFLDWLFSD
jgi:lactobin A/cerein 7B family class IIb bacteriocin